MWLVCPPRDTIRKSIRSDDTLRYVTFVLFVLRCIIWLPGREWMKHDTRYRIFKNKIYIYIYITDVIFSIRPPTCTTPMQQMVGKPHSQILTFTITMCQWEYYWAIILSSSESSRVESSRVESSRVEPFRFVSISSPRFSAVTALLPYDIPRIIAGSPTIKVDITHHTLPNNQYEYGAMNYKLSATIMGTQYDR